MRPLLGLGDHRVREIDWALDRGPLVGRWIGICLLSEIGEGSLVGILPREGNTEQWEKWWIFGKLKLNIYSSNYKIVMKIHSLC